MGLLDDRVWAGKIFSGTWVDGSGDAYAAVEPATGAELAQVGGASPADVAKAAERAADAQRDWARVPYDQRARVLRRAGQLFVEHADELNDWIVREPGALRPFAEFQTLAVASEECWEAAATPWSSNPTHAPPSAGVWRSLASSPRPDYPTDSSMCSRAGRTSARRSSSTR